MTLGRLSALVIAAVAVLSLTAPHAAAAPAVTPARAAAPPITITVRTVPALPQLHFTLDGVPLETDATGVFTVTRPHDFDPHSLVLVDTRVELENKQLNFARWAGQRDADQAYNPSIQLSMRVNNELTAAFEQQEHVTPTFLYSDGRPIEVGRINSATARSDTGELVSVPSSGGVWLASTRVGYRDGGIVVKDISYSWQTLVVDGTNIIDAGRQSFTPATAERTTVTGAFYTLTVRGRDALLRWGSGSEVTLTLPDGTSRVAPMGADHSVAFTDLARGVYEVKVTAKASIVATQFVRVSDDTQVEIRVIGPADLGLLFILVLGLAIGVVLIGRRSLRERLGQGLRWTLARVVRA
jgi:hypothetical protein